jgi:hypothetical protein
MARDVAGYVPKAGAMASGVYSIFDPALYRNHAAKWHFSQENATFDALEMSTSGSKML